MSQPVYDKLIAVLDVLIDEFGGQMKLRGVKTALLIQQATLEGLRISISEVQQATVAGRGMTASEIAKQSGAPLETVRRYIQSYTEIGNLRAIEDPEDSRKTRVLYQDPAMVDGALEAIWTDLEQVDRAQFNLR